MERNACSMARQLQRAAGSFREGTAESRSPDGHAERRDGSAFDSGREVEAHLRSGLLRLYPFPRQQADAVARPGDPPAQLYDGRFIAEKVEPDIVLKGVPDEYRSMVETRVIETDSEGLLFVINRGLYDHEPEVAVKGYEPIKAKVGMYSVTKQLLN